MSTRGSNWIVVVARNNLSLLKQAVASFNAQDVEGGVRVMCVDNGSTDGVPHYLHQHGEIDAIHNMPQRGVSHAWNQALRYVFSLAGARRVERVLVCNSDVVLRPDTWRRLADERAQFVTAVGTDDPRLIASPYPEPRPDARRPHPDFSCFMISRECYTLVGPFDENFKGAYGEDSDMHVRMHDAGIEAYCIDLPFLHVGGGAQTVKRADETEQRRITKQAAANRAYFLKKWGFPIPTPENGGVEYYKHFGTGAPQ